MSQHRMILTRGEDQEEVSIIVHYTSHGAIRGAREGGRGLPLEPDEPAHLEIDGVTDEHGKPLDTTLEENDDIAHSINDAVFDRNYAD